MADLSYARQDATPLYPKVLINRPVSRAGAGRLLMVGGHAQDFSLPTTIYQVAMAAGLGECTVVLPDSLLKLLGGMGATVFAASSPSGSLAPQARGQILELAEESDVVAIGGNLSNNSETSILVEHLLGDILRPVIIFDDAITIIEHNSSLITDRSSTLVVTTMPEMFKLAKVLRVPITIRRDGGILNKLEIVRDIAAASSCDYVVYGSETIVSAGGQIGFTPANYRLSLVPAFIYGVIATFLTQNPGTVFEGLMTAAYIINKVGQTVASTEHPSLTALTKTLQAELDQAGW
jgi:NAD(P)H-hydrate repair Nnr-like enzyme with NAD(P)H-hydrate dehydratase domain